MTKDDKSICQEALDYVEKTGSVTLAARELGIPRRTLADRHDRAINVYGLTPSKSSTKARAKAESKKTKVQIVKREIAPAELLAADRKVRAVETEKKDAALKLKESEKENEELRDRLNLMLDIEEGQGARRRLSIPSYNDSDGQGIFCGVASDWHIEEDVTPESVPGYENEYNPEIAEARAKKFFQSYVFMLDAWRHVGKCDTAVLAILGDIITGYIHEELMESNHMSPSKAVLFGQELLGAGIEYILKNGNLKKLILPCSYGNHGRTTPKSRIHTGADNSFEYLLYRTMQKEWKSEKRLDWHIAEGYHVNVDLFGHRVRFHHGDAIGYGGGVGGITIPVRKKIANWNSGSAKPAELDVFGHFHQLIDGGNFISNGSLIGYNAFALNIGAAYEPPRQACFWIDAVRGKTMSGQLYVE
jgi:hypothetical protein